MAYDHTIVWRPGFRGTQHPGRCGSCKRGALYLCTQVVHRGGTCYHVLRHLCEFHALRFITVNRIPRLPSKGDWRVKADAKWNNARERETIAFEKKQMRAGLI